MIYKIVSIAILASLIFYAVWDGGRDFERNICNRRSLTQVEKNIQVEKKQNEIRTHNITDDAFLDRLRRGQFGRIEN
jgi:hypothetical protein